MEKEIQKIKIGKRFRKDIGDLTDLKDSIKEIGLLHPIVIDEKNKLIAGFRRLSAFKELGYKRISVNVVNMDKFLDGERDENVIRKDFTPSERDAIYKAMPSYEHKGNLVSDSDTKGIKRRKRASKKLGVSTDTLSKTRQVIEAKEKAKTKKDKKIYSDIVDEMDKTGNVNRAYLKVKSLKRKPFIVPKPPKGKYNTIVIDPPWPMEFMKLDNRPNQVEMPYPIMSIEEITNSPIVPDIASDNCNLFMWTTHRFLPDSFDIVKAWGFDYHVCLTWDKTNGRSLCGFNRRTEFVIYAHKGKITVNQRGRFIDSIFTEKLREHSRKPNIFYDMLRTNTPAPRIDIFSREEIDGFVQYGNEPDKFTLEKR